jgi:hypothetical protein
MKKQRQNSDSALSRNNREDFSTACSFKQLPFCFRLKADQESKQILKSTERTCLEKILDELRADRQCATKYKEEKKRSAGQLWNLFGNLLGLEKDKFD